MPGTCSLARSNRPVLRWEGFAVRAWAQRAEVACGVRRRCSSTRGQHMQIPAPVGRCSPACKKGFHFQALFLRLCPAWCHASTFCESCSHALLTRTLMLLHLCVAA